jgi:hypothetical protein
MTLSIMLCFSLKKLSILGLFVTLRINDTQPNVIQPKDTYNNKTYVMPQTKDIHHYGLSCDTQHK